MLSATLVDCECDLETLQELERSYKLTYQSGEKGVLVMIRAQTCVRLYDTKSWELIGALFQALRTTVIRLFTLPDHEGSSPQI